MNGPGAYWSCSVSHEEMATWTSKPTCLVTFSQHA